MNQKITVEFTYSMNIELDRQHPDFKKEFEEEFDGCYQDLISHVEHYGAHHDVVKQFAWLKVGDTELVDTDFTFENSQDEPF